MALLHPEISQQSMAGNLLEVKEGVTLASADVHMCP